MAYTTSLFVGAEKRESAHNALDSYSRVEDLRV